MASKTLPKARSFHVSVRAILGRLGKTAGLSRVVLLYEETKSSEDGRHEHYVVQEWCALGVPTYAECGLSAVSPAAAPDLLPALHSNKFVWKYIGEVTRTLHKALRRVDIQAIGYAPFFVDGRYAGCLAFEDGATPPRRWQAAQVDALMMAANVIGAAVQRQRLAAQIAAGEECCASLRRAGETLLHGAERLATEHRVNAFTEVILAAAVKTVGAHAGSVSVRVPGAAPTAFRPLVSWEGTVLSPEKIAADPFLGHLEELSATDPEGIFSSLVRGESSIIRVKDMRRQRRTAYNYHVARGHRVVWRMPLVLLDQVLGFFCLSLTDDRPFGEVERETVATLSRQLVLALELTRLGEQASEAAVTLERERAVLERTSAALQERNRLAGEIHDTLAQGFASMLLHAEGAEETLRLAPSQLPTCLQKIKVLARSNLAEARRSVWALSTPDSGETTQDLSTMLHRSSQLIVAEIVAPAAAPRRRFRLVGIVRPLPPGMERELVRISQEALRNAIRHACATSITTTLKYLAGHIELRVADDGCGLKKRAGVDGYIAANGAGLCFMRERAVRLGGELFLSNAPRCGTIVTARVPTAAAGLPR